MFAILFIFFSLVNLGQFDLIMREQYLEPESEKEQNPQILQKPGTVMLKYGFGCKLILAHHS